MTSSICFQGEKSNIFSEVPVENAIDLLDDSGEDEKSSHDGCNSVQEDLSRGKHYESNEDGSDDEFNEDGTDDGFSREESGDEVKSFFLIVQLTDQIVRKKMILVQFGRATSTLEKMKVQARQSLMNQ